MPDIFDEIQDDLRAERAGRLGRRFAGLAAVLVVAIVAGTGAYVYLHQQNIDQANAVADRYIVAAKQADAAAGLNGAEDGQKAATSLAGIVAHGPEGYQVLARLRLAALQWQLGARKQAITNWAALSADGSAPHLLRDLATLTSAEHQLDDGDPVLLKQSLESLTAPDNPWRPLAEQVIALLELRTGHDREAADTMRDLSANPFVPQGIRQMAGDLLTTLPPDALAPAAAPPPPKTTSKPTPAKPPISTVTQPHG